MLGPNASRIADGEPPLEPSQPQGADMLTQPITLARIHQYLSMVMPLLFARQQDTFGALGLAINACSEPNGHRKELGQIYDLLVAARDSLADAARGGRRDRGARHRAHRRAAHPSGRHRRGDDECVRSS